jgi:cytochrome c-type biogenesis protein
VAQGVAQLALAFGAGTLTFASPCVLPIVPGYIGLICADGAAATPRTRRQRVLPVMAFIAGFTVIFTILGAGANLLGGVLQENQRTIEVIGGSFLILAAIPR